MSIQQADFTAATPLMLRKLATGQDHPTPVHITSAIREELHDAAFDRGEFVPQWVLDCLDRGRLRACAEYDREVM